MALIETGRETIGGPVSTGKHILVIDSTCNVVPPAPPPPWFHPVAPTHNCYACFTRLVGACVNMAHLGFHFE
jgi:hypothetical protein